MRILITGGGGFLGSHLGDHLLRQGHEVFALDTAKDFKVRHNLGNPRFHYVKDSILAGDMLESLVRRCEVIYHLAAVVGVEHYVADPYSVLNVNINGTQAVLRLALLYDRKVVFSSTSEIYGRNPDVPFREESERVLGPTTIDRWCYSTSKAAGEHFCFAYAKMGVPVVVVRYFNAYGPRLDQLDVGRILTIFMGQLLRGEHLTVIGDGRQTRCFTYVDDAIRATITAATKPEAEGRVFNIGVEKETTIRELAETMIDVYGDLTGQHKSKIRFVKQEDVYGKSYEDIRRRVPDTTRMRKELKVQPLVDLREGVRRTMKWFLDAQATAGEGERVVGPGVAKAASKAPTAASKGRTVRTGRKGRTTGRRGRTASRKGRKGRRGR